MIKIILNLLPLSLSIYLVHLEKIGKVDDALMKAVVTKEIAWTYVLQIDFIPRPQITQNQILVEVEAAGINNFDYYIRGVNRPKMPPILGREVSGIVKETNTTIWHFELGDRVFCATENGGYAEFVAAHVSDCYPLSSKLSFTQGAILYYTYFPVCRALIGKAKIKQSEIVLIHGTDGEWGVPAIQIAKAAGAYVVATTESSIFENLAKKAGADYIVNERGSDYITQAIDHLNGTKFDVIFTLRYNTDMIKEKEYLNQNGRIVFQITGEHASNHTEHTYSEGSTMFAVSQIKYSAKEQKDAADFVLKAIEDDWVKPIIAREYCFQEVEMAHRDLIQPGPKKSRLVLTTT